MKTDLRSLPKRSDLERYEMMFPNIDIEGIITFLMFQQVSRGLQKEFDAFFSLNHLTEAKFTLLMLLYRQPDHALSPTQLATMLGVKKPTITGIVGGIVDQGFISKVINVEDKRNYSLTLTEEGVNFLEAYLEKHYTKANEVMAVLSDQEKKQLQKILEKMNQIGDTNESN